VISELWQFMKQNKKFWLAPIIIVLVLIGVLLAVAGSSALAPFIYTLF
jgi:competence protein ComGC